MVRRSFSYMWLLLILIALIAIDIPAATAKSTLDLDVQKIAYQALKGRRGSIVVLDPATGEVKVMVSRGFGKRALTFRSLKKMKFNPATQAMMTPASASKALVATAAFDLGIVTPKKLLNGNNDMPIGCATIQNPQRKSWGQIDIGTAMAASLNTPFAQLLTMMGPKKFDRYLKRFGFYSKPPLLGYPKTKLVASGGIQYPKTGFLTDLDGCQFLGPWTMLRVTPLQMAMVAAAIGNHGKLMTPYIQKSALEKGKPRVFSTVMKPKTAKLVTQTMRKAVTLPVGTCRGAAVPGTKVACKTGGGHVIGGLSSGYFAETWVIANVTKRGKKLTMAVVADGDLNETSADVAVPITKKVIEGL